jgi:hypothetical protein
LVIVFSQTANATPPIRPEFEAYRLYVSGNTERGREIFRNVLAHRMEDLLHKPISGRRSSSELVQIWSSRLVGCTLTLTGWMRTEGWLRVNRGAQTPPDVIDTIADAATNLAVYAEALSASAEAMLTPQDDRALAYLSSKNEKLGRLLYISLGFLRDTGRDSLRPDLFAVARHYRELPATLEQFDREHPNAAEIMDVHPEPPPPPTPKPSPWTEIAGDYPIAVLVKNYYEALYEGDISALQSLFVEGYWPEDRMLAAIERLSADSFLNVGKLRVRDIGNDELEMWVTDAGSLGPNGEKHTWDDKIIVQRISEGQYRISYTRSEASRKAWEELENR